MYVSANARTAARWLVPLALVVAALPASGSRALAAPDATPAQESAEQD